MDTKPIVEHVSMVTCYTKFALETKSNEFYNNEILNPTLIKIWEYFSLTFYICIFINDFNGTKILTYITILHKWFLKLYEVCKIR